MAGRRKRTRVSFHMAPSDAARLDLAQGSNFVTYIPFLSLEVVISLLLHVLETENG